MIGRHAVTRIGIVEPLPPVRMAVITQSSGLTDVGVAIAVVVVAGSVEGASGFVVVTGSVVAAGIVVVGLGNVTVVVGAGVVVVGRGTVVVGAGRNTEADCKVVEMARRTGGSWLPSVKVGRSSTSSGSVLPLPATRWTLANQSNSCVDEFGTFIVPYHVRRLPRYQ